jgi:hypothetical protein
MTLKNQVCSLDLAKRLKELGVNRESNYVWYCFKDDEPRLLHGTGYGKTDKSEMWPTYSVAELGTMLPVSIKMNGETHWYLCTKTTYTNRCGYVWNHNGIEGWGRYSNAVSHAVGEAKTEVNARAKMLIYLLENNLLP